MTTRITFISDPQEKVLDAGLQVMVQDVVGNVVVAQQWLSPHEALTLDIATPYTVEAGRVLVAQLQARLHAQPVDVVVHDAATATRKKLLVADMDSTILTGECLDELAAYVGLQEPIAAITARAMNGEINFKEALRQRMAMLKGLPLSAIAATIERLEFMAGSATLLATMRGHGAYCALVSGGFKPFTGWVRETLGFHVDAANELLAENDMLTGEVAEPILDGNIKLSTLQQLVAQQRLDMVDSLTVGDGANDLAMLKAAGLGVAFRAKPAVAEQAKHALKHADLTGLLFLQGYRRVEFINPAGI